MDIDSDILISSFPIVIGILIFFALGDIAIELRKANELAEKRQDDFKKVMELV